ncbi:MAG TPA: alkaline phosphatase family protein [Candidatus Dormibacteraeota bacterium]
MRHTTVSHAAITLAVVIGFGVAPQVAGRPAAAATPHARLAAATVTQAGLAVATGKPHVLVVMEENRGYKATLGTCSADPYLCSLASGYASYTSWFGILHNSLPDYIAIIGGSTHGCPGSACGVTDLGGQLSKAGTPWTAYMESMPSPCYLGSTSGQYTLTHNGFAHFHDDNTGPCHVLPYPGSIKTVAALTGVSAPDYVWITPNQLNDMHSGSVQQGDAWLKANLAPVLASSWFKNFNSTVIVTMDENNAQPLPAGGQVPMVVISNAAKGQGHLTMQGNHYGTLRAIEEAYGLTRLGAAANAANGDPSGSF